MRLYIEIIGRQRWLLSEYLNVFISYLFYYKIYIIGNFYDFYDFDRN